MLFRSALAAKQDTFPENRPAFPNLKHTSEILALWGGGSYALFTCLLMLFASVQTRMLLLAQSFYR